MRTGKKETHSQTDHAHSSIFRHNVASGVRAVVVCDCHCLDQAVMAIESLLRSKTTTDVVEAIEFRELYFTLNVCVCATVSLLHSKAATDVVTSHFVASKPFCCQCDMHHSAFVYLYVCMYVQSYS